MDLIEAQQKQSHRSKIFMSVAHRGGIVAHSPSHRGSARPCHALYALTMNPLQRRLCYLGIVNLGDSATLPLCSWRSGQLQTLFKCSPKVGVTLLDSMTNSEQFHSRVIEEGKAIFHAHCSYKMTYQLAIVPTL